MTNTEVIDRLMKLVTENPSIVRLELGNKEVYKPKYDENRNLYRRER
jgi:precorrin-4 methylase